MSFAKLLVLSPDKLIKCCKSLILKFVSADNLSIITCCCSADNELIKSAACEAITPLVVGSSI